LFAGVAIPFFVFSLSAHETEWVFSMFNGLSRAETPARKRPKAAVTDANFMVAVVDEESREGVLIEKTGVSLAEARVSESSPQ
jgi:hypothetical protein